jgi:endonuclease/exonuclease/phosphatase family metal-dependent hydrolase
MTRLHVSSHLSAKVLSALFLLLVSLSTLSAHAAGSSSLVISQLYGGGGNTGATYTNDYVEIFNRSTSAVSLSGYSLQYASATTTGTASGVTVLNTVTIPAGGYYLVELATGGANGVAIPTTPDQINLTVNMSATGGRAYLVNGTTALSGSALCGDPSIIDWVGFGTTPVCAEGSPSSNASAAPAPSITTMDLRGGSGCTDTDVNSADFTVATLGSPLPHNSSSAAHSCTATPTATTTFTPASITQGSSSLLTVAVANAGTVSSVTANLSALGGSSTQPLYDDGTHGDATSGDGTYSFTVSTSSSLATGPYTVTPTVTSGTSVTATTAALTVTTSVGATAIHTIQKTPATYLGTVVNVSGIVTGVTSNGFYLQAKDSDADTDLTTSEAIFVKTGTTLPAAAVVANNVQLLGTVAYSQPSATSYIAQALELDSPTGYNILLTGQTLPTAITLTSTNLSPTGSATQLLQYQSMRVTAPSLTATSGTGGTLTETAATYTTTGQFYAVLTGAARPFRAIGADSRDAAPTAGSPASWTRWTAPTNLLLVDSSALGGTPVLDITTGAILAPTTGVLDYTTGQPALLISSVTAERPVVTAGSPGTTATSAASTQLSVATLNMQRFYDTETTVTGAVTVTSAGYTLRLAKASNAIRNALGTPDVIALQQVESAAELATLSSQISTDAVAASQTDPAYVVTMGAIGPNGYGEAFLTKPSKVTVSGSGNLASGGCGSYCYTDPTTGTSKAIWDNNPLYINAKALRGSVPSNAYGIYIINAELLPTTGINSNTVSGLSTVGAGVRAKRLAQAQQLAGSVIALGTSQPIIVAGNLNAYEFSDGYVDVLGILTNSQVASNTVVAYNSITYNTNLSNLVPSLTAANRYTVNENGVADTLDHILVTASLPTGTTLQAVHINSDFNATARNTSTTPNRTSDHDALVATVQVPQLAAALSFNPPLTSTLTFSSQAVGTSSASKPVVVTNTSTTTAITITSIVASAGFSQTNNCGASIAALGTCTINIVFSPTTAGTPTGTVVLTDTDVTGTQTISLSGTSYNLATTTTTVTSTPAAPVFGQTVTLTATIPGNGTTVPSGTVTFKDGATTLGSAITLTAGTSSSTASYTATGLTAATHSITAVYSGDSTFATSTGTLSLVVAPVSTATFVTISPASAGTGNPVTFTASVSANLGTPGGTVQFYDGSATIGAVQTLVAGAASYTTSTLALGTHSITAVYSGATGTTIYPASTSTAVSITILQSDFSMTLANTQLIVGGSIKSASTGISIVAVNGFTSPITFTCTGLPASSTCVFAPATVTPAGFASSTLTIVTNAAANHAPHFGFRGSETVAFAFTLLLAPFAFRKRRSALRLLALAVLLIAGMQALTGCGSGVTPSGTNTVTVTATSVSGTVHTATVTLITQ